MTIKTINAKQIRDISAEGITYTDDDGRVGLIVFEECYQNYLKTRLSPGHLRAYSDEERPEMIERIKAHKEIGRRNMLGYYKGHSFDSDPKLDNPYFLLYPEPPIAIECDDVAEFNKLVCEFYKHGWRTLDIT